MVNQCPASARKQMQHCEPFDREYLESNENFPREQKILREDPTIRSEKLHRGIGNPSPLLRDGLYSDVYLRRLPKTGKR